MYCAAQVYYNKEAGTKKITTETGAGQWGSALAWSGMQFDMPIEVFQVSLSLSLSLSLSFCVSLSLSFSHPPALR